MKESITGIVVVRDGTPYRSEFHLEKKCQFCAFRRTCYKGDSWVFTDDRPDFYFCMLCQNGVPGAGVFVRLWRMAILRMAEEARL